MNEPEVTLSARIPADLRRAIKHFCADSGCTIQQFVYYSAQAYLTSLKSPVRVRVPRDPKA